MGCWNLPAHRAYLCRALEPADAHFAICYSPKINSRPYKLNFTLASALSVLFYQDLARSLFVNLDPRCSDPQEVFQPPPVMSKLAFPCLSIHLMNCQLIC